MAIENVVSQGFDADCREAVGRLRTALLTLYQAVGADPAKPQDVSREFRLDKSLTWKLSKALSSDDPYEAASILPGSGGIDILLGVMTKRDAAYQAISDVRVASEALEVVVARHAGDRETLRLIIDSMGRNGKSMELSRKQAFRGNSGIWGLQCSVRLSANFISPSTEDAHMLDLALVGGWTNVRRLRPIERWPIHDLHRFSDDGSLTEKGPRFQPLGPLNEYGGWVLSDFCSGAMPELHMQELPGQMRFEMGEGPVGRTGEFSCFIGHVHRQAVPRHRGGGHKYGQFRSGIALPVETMMADLFVHEQLTEAMPPEVVHFGRLPRDISETDPSHCLPVPVRMTDLGMNPSVATPLVERYDMLIEYAARVIGWKLNDFRGYRVVYKYPPMLSTVGLRYELPEPGTM